MKRPFVLFVPFIILGIFLAILTEIPYLFVVVCVIAAVLYAFKKTRLAAIGLLLCALAMISAQAKITTYSETYTGTVKCVVSEVNEGISRSFITADARTIDGDLIGNGRMLVNFNSSQDVLPGDTVVFYGSCYPAFFHVASVKVPYASKISYSAYASGFFSLSHTDILQTGIYRTKQRIAALADAQTPTGSLLYACVCGDTGYVDDYSHLIFSLTGISHLLAVSGLHTGIFIFLLNNLLTLFKLGPKVRLIVIAPFLIAYCYFSGLSPSVIRASVMACTLLVASVAGMRYDMVNSLFMCAAVFLLISPFTLFELSFQLSFCACFGIAVFSKFKRCPSLAMTLGATVYTLPITLKTFSNLPLSSILANLLLVPVFSLAIGLFITFLIPSLFISSFSSLLSIPKLLVSASTVLIEFLSTTPVLKITFITTLSAFVLLTAMFILSRFIHFKRLFKSLAAIIAAAVVLFCALQQQPAIPCTLVVPLWENSAILYCNGTVSLFGMDLSHIEDTAGICKEYDYIFLLNDSQINAYYMSFSYSVNGKNVYVPENIYSGDPYVTPVEEGALITVAEHTAEFKNGGVLLHTQQGAVMLFATEPSDRQYFISVGEQDIKAQFSISYNSDNINAQYVLKTALCGGASIILDDKFSVNTAGKNE